MKQELEDIIVKNHPLMFPNQDFGIQCGDGWFDLIETLCSNIQSYIDNNKERDPSIKQVEVLQIKEKFGSLRFYASGGNATTGGMIWFAESMSTKICEVCGKPGKRIGGGWVRTLCEEHAKPRKDNELT